MKFNIPSSLMLLLIICSIPFFASCTKDTDLFGESVVLDSETTPTQDFSRDDVQNVTFENADEWDLINGSTITDGVLRLVTSGRIQSSPENWSAQYTNVSVQSFYQTRRYRLTFTARRVSGNDIFRIGQRYIPVFNDTLTTDFETYTVEFNGEGNPSGNDLAFGGDAVGDVFEIKDVMLEDIGASLIDGQEGPGSSAQLTFYTDFETDDQFSENGGKTEFPSQWEVDHGNPRTTDHPDSPLRAGRDGTGRAVWLGSYNNNQTRNEIGRDEPLSYREYWLGVSVYVQTPMNRTRIMMQNRQIANGSSATINTLALRQAEDPGQLYFSIATDPNSVDVTPTNGAGSNTESVFFDYNVGEWIDIVFHYKGGFGADYTGPDTSTITEVLGVDPRRDGLIEIWVNGEKLVDHVGTTAYRYAKHGQEVTGTISPTIGTYWSSAFAPQGDVYYDNYRLWVGPDGDYENVDPSE